MVSGKYMTSPILLINLAGEMVYVLNQRLMTQSLPEDRFVKIMNEIAEAIFNQSFVEELFLNNKTLSLEFLKTIFQKLVHSSVMKLSAHSFSKLFDLMLMGVKLQTFLSSSPLELYIITLNHLEGIMKLMKKGSATALLEQTIAKFKGKYSKLSFGQYLEIKLELLNKFKAENLRIYSFLQQYYQDKEHGYLYLYRRYAPHISSPIGTCTYSNSQEKLQLGSRDIKVNQFASDDFRNWTSELGKNMYSGIYPLKGHLNSKLESERSIEEMGPADRSLNEMILGNRKQEQIEFTLDLFSQKNKDSVPSKLSKEQEKQPIKIKSTMSNLKQTILREMENTKKEQQQEDEYDILQMMDEAMKKQK